MKRSDHSCFDPPMNCAAGVHHQHSSRLISLSLPGRHIPADRGSFGIENSAPLSGLFSESLRMNKHLTLHSAGAGNGPCRHHLPGLFHTHPGTSSFHIPHPEPSPVLHVRRGLEDEPNSGPDHPSPSDRSCCAGLRASGNRRNQQRSPLVTAHTNLTAVSLGRLAGVPLVD